VEKPVKGAGSFDMNAHPVWQRLFESWEKKEEFQESYLAGKEKGRLRKDIKCEPRIFISAYPRIS
jgi:hypothetical protein